MGAHRARSRWLLVSILATALTTPLAGGSLASAHNAPRICASSDVAEVRGVAAAQAAKVSRGARHSAARRRALRASLIAQALRKAGCWGVPKPTARKPIKSAPDGTVDNAATPVSPSAPSGTGSGTSIGPTPSPIVGQSWWTGIQGGANDYDARVGASLGARVVRTEFEIGTPVAAMREFVADYADRGVRVLPLAGFHGRLPTTAEAQNLATWAREFGPNGVFWASRPGRPAFPITHIEFGNETSFAYQGTHKRGAEYARRVREAVLAIRAAGPDAAAVGLLVQADNANQSDNWVGQMYSAVANLHDYVAGWTVHPYGPEARWQNRLDDAIAETAAKGAPSNIPIDITEWGIATDNGRCLDDNYGWDKCMTFEQAGAALSSTVAGMRARYGGRIRHFLIYHGRDLRQSGRTSDREHYFGLQTLGEQSKGAFTAAAKAVLAL